MNAILKIAALAVCTVILINIFKRAAPEYSNIISIVSGICILCYAAGQIVSLTDEIKRFLPFSSESLESIRIFFKCILICTVCSLTKDFCREHSGAFLASCIDLTEKAAIIIVSMPLFRSVTEIILKFIGT